jgi:hypothetical protein
MRVGLPGVGGLATYIVYVPCGSVSPRPGVDHSVPSHYLAGRLLASRSLAGELSAGRLWSVDS